MPFSFNILYITITNSSLVSVSTTGSFASVVPAAALEVPNSIVFFNLFVLDISPFVPVKDIDLLIVPFKASITSSLFATKMLPPACNSNGSSFSIFLIKISALVWPIKGPKLAVFLRSFGLNPSGNLSIISSMGKSNFSRICFKT